MGKGLIKGATVFIYYRTVVLQYDLIVVILSVKLTVYTVSYHYLFFGVGSSTEYGAQTCSVNSAAPVSVRLAADLVCTGVVLNDV